MAFRLIVAVGMTVALASTESARMTRAQEAVPLPDSRIALFVTFPMTAGFADATEALVDTRRFVSEALKSIDDVRLAERPEDSDAVLTVLGRGMGNSELAMAINALDRGVMAPRVMISPAERYVEAMITVGSCAPPPRKARDQAPPPPCYRKVFVGLGLTDRPARPNTKDPARNSWSACADALARDVEAWAAENAASLLARRR